jgi:hypothetical protein
MNPWKSIFTQSPVNNGTYDEDELPQQIWQWPKGTWFQARLGYIREQQPMANLRSGKKIRNNYDMRTL